MVYKAIHKSSKNVRAIKEIKRDCISEESEKELMNEINILKTLVNRILLNRITQILSNYTNFLLMIIITT